YQSFAEAVAAASKVTISIAGSQSEYRGREGVGVIGISNSRARLRTGARVRIVSLSFRTGEATPAALRGLPRGTRASPGAPGLPEGAGPCRPRWRSRGRARFPGAPAPAPEVGQHQFARAAFRQRLQGFGVDHFRNELAFDDVETAGHLGTLERNRARLGHPVVVVEPGAPGLFDPRPGGRDVPARLPR